MTTWYSNPGARHWVSGMTAPQVGAFHQSLPGYAPTPLVDLPSLAAELVGRVLVKDESARLGLPAFKVLGASWACSRVLQSGPAVLVTATDGNHGRALARMAALPRHDRDRSRPGGDVARDRGAHRGRRREGHSDRWRLRRRRSGRGRARRGRAGTGVGAGQSRGPGARWVPGWIVEGLRRRRCSPRWTSSSGELLTSWRCRSEGSCSWRRSCGRALPARGPVGAAWIWMRGGAQRRVLAVEPDTAACVITSFATGRPSTVPTGATVMAGLNCGTISSLAWPVLATGW